MKKEILAASVLIGLTAIAVKAQDKPLETVKNVDISKYLGKWYEIAAFPQRFEKGCSCTTAEYSIKENGTIEVKNSCIKKGKPSGATGKAFITDKKSNAKLKVQFFWPFKGKYWIIALAPDYSYAMVGHPNRKYLWILNRKPVMNDQTYNHVAMLASSKGFDIRNLVRTNQDCSK
jgi:apolipoprotein D and lipocalin family protein